MSKILEKDDINEGIFDFFKKKPTPDERIAEHILKKLETEIPRVDYQFIDYPTFGRLTDIYGIKTNDGTLEAEMFRVDFKNNSNPITKNPNSGFLQGGDFGVCKVSEIRYQRDTGDGWTKGYGVKLTGEKEALDIPNSLAKKIFEKVKEHQGNFRVFKATRKLDKGDQDETEMFEPLE